jgi:uncharacterized membrane protein
MFRASFVKILTMVTVGKLLVLLLTLIHLGIIFIILFGWAFPELHYLYGACLIFTALSCLLLQRCVLVDIEYYVRAFFKLNREHKANSFTATFINRIIGR